MRGLAKEALGWPMSTEKYTPSGKLANSDKSVSPDHKGGNARPKAQRWSGGRAAAKGSVSHASKSHQNSSGKS